MICLFPDVNFDHEVIAVLAKYFHGKFIVTL